MLNESRHSVEQRLWFCKCLLQFALLTKSSARETKSLQFIHIIEQDKARANGKCCNAKFLYRNESRVRLIFEEV
jgi:hypothetical protein